MPGFDIHPHISEHPYTYPFAREHHTKKSRREKRSLSLGCLRRVICTIATTTRGRMQFLRTKTGRWQLQKQPPHVHTQIHRARSGMREREREVSTELLKSTTMTGSVCQGRSKTEWCASERLFVPSRARCAPGLVFNYVRRSIFGPSGDARLCAVCVLACARACVCVYREGERYGVDEACACNSLLRTPEFKLGLYTYILRVTIYTICDCFLRQN